VRRIHRTALLVLCALGGCSDAPLCRYWTDAPIRRDVLDPSAAPMLPYNPYWGSAAPTAPDSCAGEPGHPGVAAD
jgi:hypothetical protein